jgi:hypothetical protein
LRTSDSGELNPASTVETPRAAKNSKTALKILGIAGSLYLLP